MARISKLILLLVLLLSINFVIADDSNENTYGFNCEQILDLKPGKDKGQLKNGCSPGPIKLFANQKGWAKDLVDTTPPIAGFSATPSYVIGGGEIIFNASLSYDDESEIVEYLWDFNDDGITDKTGKTVTKRYSICDKDPPGTHKVTLTLINSFNLSSSKTLEITLYHYALDSLIIGFNGLAQDNVIAKTYFGDNFFNKTINSEFREYFSGDLDSIANQLDNVDEIKIGSWFRIINGAGFHTSYQSTSHEEMEKSLDEIKSKLESRWYTKYIDYNGILCSF